MNCPENPQKSQNPVGGGVEVLGVKKSKVREMSWTAQKIHKKSQNPVGGGVGWKF